MKNVSIRKKLKEYNTTSRGLSRIPKSNLPLKKIALSTLPVLSIALATIEKTIAQTFFHTTSSFAFTGTVSTVTKDLNGPFGVASFYVLGSSNHSLNPNANFQVIKHCVTCNGTAKLFDSGVNIQNNNVSFVTGFPPGLQINKNPPNPVTASKYVVFKDATRIGWMRLTSAGNQLTIHEYAYTTANNISTGQTALPVELSAFEIQPKADALGLFWATTSEENNAGFELQRSRDGQNFKTIAFIEGAGTSVEAQEYYYDDKAIKRNKTYYYRLKQIDYDGQFEYSQVVSGMLHSTDRAVGEFYPNPVVNGTSQIDYTAQSSTTLSIDVYSTAGQLLRSETCDVAAGLNTLAFDFGDLPSGMVFVKIAEGGDAVYKKVMIR